MMAGPTYCVTANRLNLRDAPALDSKVLIALVRDTNVEFLEDDADWWKVRVASQDGYVARKYLAPVSNAQLPLPPGVNAVLWAEHQARQGNVQYKLGVKDIAKGMIDCSGWVAHLTGMAFDAVNKAASPETIYDRGDYHAFDTHSDGIITGIQARTGWILRGTEVAGPNLREGMLIGCNFGDYDWENNIPPRIYGVDHIVQVMRDPGSNALMITQSSSGKGVNALDLAAWLDARRPMAAAGKIYAVDPFAMADRNTRFLGNPAPAIA